MGGLFGTFLVIGMIGNAVSGAKGTPTATTSEVTTPAAPSPRAVASKAAGPVVSKPARIASPTVAAQPQPAAALAKFSGRGDKIVRLSGAAATDAVIVTLTHKGSANFIVSPLDATGQEGSTMVNEIGKYSGTVPLNFHDGDQTPAIKIQADGAWTLTVRPVTQAPSWNGAKGLTSRGDQVFIIKSAVTHDGLNTVTMTHSGEANFIVDVIGTNSGEANLINEIGHYEGQQVLPTDSFLLVVRADGAWTLTKD